MSLSVDWASLAGRLRRAPDAGAPNLLRLGCSIPKRRKSAEVLGFDEARVAGDA